MKGGRKEEGKDGTIFCKISECIDNEIVVFVTY